MQPNILGMSVLAVTLCSFLLVTTIVAEDSSAAFGEAPASFVQFDDLTLDLDAEKSGSSKNKRQAPSPAPSPPDWKELNLAPDVSEDYPVVFSIILFLSIILILALIAISVAISTMDPGRDSLIYRVTSAQRFKKDN